MKVFLIDQLNCIHLFFPDMVIFLKRRGGSESHIFMQTKRIPLHVRLYLNTVFSLLLSISVLALINCNTPGLCTCAHIWGIYVAVVVGVLRRGLLQDQVHLSHHTTVRRAESLTLGWALCQLPWQCQWRCPGRPLLWTLSAWFLWIQDTSDSPGRLP